MPQDRPTTRMGRLRRLFEPDFVHSEAARIGAGTFVMVGFLIILFGWNDLELTHWGFVLAIAGNTFRLINIGDSVKSEARKDLTPDE